MPYLAPNAPKANFHSLSSPGCWYPQMGHILLHLAVWSQPVPEVVAVVVAGM